MTRVELKQSAIDYKYGRIEYEQFESAVEAFEKALLQQTPVSRSPLFGIFSFAGERYVGYWSSYEAAEQVMHDEYNDDEWYVDELVCQDCG